MKKVIVCIIAALVIISGGIVIYKNNSRKSANSSSQYMKAAVTYEDIKSTVSGSGSVIPLNSGSISSSSRDTVYQVLVSKDQTVNAGQTLVTFENGSAAVTAPYSGVISQVNVSSGDSVNTGQPLLSIFDNKNFYTSISVDETDIPSLKLGQKVNIKVNAFPSENFTGTVKDIGQQGSYSNGVSTFNVVIYFDNIGSIKSGMSTEASIVTASKNKVLAVPIEAIRDENGKKFVILASDGSKKRLQEVQVGINNGKMAEITSGLKAGEQVQLPQTTSSSSSQSSKLGRNGFGMMRSGGSGSSRRGSEGGTTQKSSTN